MPKSLHSNLEAGVARSAMGSTLFAELPTATRERLLAGSSVREFADGQIITLRHEEADGFWLVEGGTVRVGQFAADGTFRAVGQLGQGDSYGELAVLTGRPRVVDAIAIDGAFLRWITAAKFQRALQDEEGARAALLGALARQVQDLLDSGFERQRLSAKERIAVTLARLCGAEQEDAVVRIAHQDLAELVGASRMTVGTALAELEGAGLLSRAYGRITVHDPAALLSMGRD